MVQRNKSDSCKNFVWLYMIHDIYANVHGLLAVGQFAVGQFAVKKNASFGYIRLS